MKRIIDYDKLEKALEEELNAPCGLTKSAISIFWDVLRKVEE